MAVETSTVQVVMPAMGDSVAEGTVLEWHKQEGDTVDVDETVVEISTDKVDAEVPSPAAGTLVKIYAAEGDTVEVGALLAEISTEGADGDARRPPPPVSGESPPATPEEAVAGATTEMEGLAAADAAVGETIEIVTPTGGESVTEGTILEWSVKVGDAVKDGDTVVEISTDKVDMELPAPASGTITEILASDGETVSVGQVIARMTAGAAPAPRQRHLHRPRKPAARRTAPRKRSPTAPTPPPWPVASRRSEGIDLSGVHGSARGGRITKADVLAAAANGARAARTARPPPRAAAISTPGAQPTPRRRPRRSRATWTRAARSRRRPRFAR